MNDLFLFPSANRADPAVEAWFARSDDVLRGFARPWFERMRGCGDDVRELLHDGHPTACAGEAAFGYVDAFKDHVNIGFYQGAVLADPARLLLGSGKRMRHVKIYWGQEIEAEALTALIETAYRDMKRRLGG